MIDFAQRTSIVRESNCDYTGSRYSFAIIASAVGIRVVITNQVIELLVSGGIVQSAETAANSDNDDEKEPYTGDARIIGQQGSRRYRESAKQSGWCG